MSSNLGTLHIVATPIGNLSDMTFRAVEILKNADCILCEDTRTTKHLLGHYEIKGKKTMSYHTHSGLAKVVDIAQMIRDGKNLALVSDAGTPGISDPGVMLISALRTEFGNDIMISPIPGPSAMIAALSASGLPTHEFTWKGFVPHKKGRETFFNQVTESDITTIFYESVHRVEKTLESLAEKMPDRQMVVAREITKMFEEIRKGTTTEIMDYFKTNPDKVRGEFVVIVSGK